MKVLTYNLLFILSFTYRITFAQDIHFSQFNGALLNISPGFTGLFNGDYRFSAIYRTQWQSVPVDYSTFNMNGETRIKPKFFAKDMLGLGVSFYNDKAGDARYGTSQLYGQVNYIYLAKPDSSLLLTFGVNMGWCQVGFDLTKMTFDSQYDGIQLNPGLPTGEHFARTKSNYFDLNIGSVVHYKIAKRKTFVFGFGLHHLTTPTLSYQGNDLSSLDFKSSNFISYAAPIASKTDIITEALIMFQGENYELVPNVMLKHYMNKEVQQAILGGISYRARDAVVVRMGYNYKTFQSGIAYDINVSQFNAASNYRGAFEIYVNYVFYVKSSYTARKRHCPVFM